MTDPSQPDALPDYPGRQPVWDTTKSLLAAARDTLKLGGPQLTLFYVLTQAAVSLVVLPILGWTVSEALAAAGLSGIDAPQLGSVFSTPLSLGLFAVVAIAGYVTVLVQLLLLLVAVRRLRAREGLRFQAVCAELGRLIKRAFRPSALGLAPYVLVLVPLAGFGFFSAITRTIAVPEFVSGELTKSISGIIGYTVFLVVVALLSLRFSLTLPFFVSSSMTGGKAGRLSWKATRKAQLPLFFAVTSVAVAAVFAGGVILAAAIVPTLASDALWPTASPSVAAVSLAFAVAAGMVVMGVAVVAIVSILLRCVELSGADLTPPHPASASPAAPTTPRQHRSSALVSGGLLLTLSLAAGFFTVPLMNEMARQPDTLVLAHRGFSGVENTIAGLEGAHTAGADLVEIDVMQTADGEFVVLHDSNLKRLSGTDAHIADLTLDEATSISVRDLQGHEDDIPALDTYLARADELGQQLLIEVKLHGRESDDFLTDLVRQIEALGVLENHIYHSLDAPSVDGLKRMRPALTVGYTMAFAGTALPETTADFVVIEEWSYSQDMTDEAHRSGLGMFVWTVNDEMKIRQLLRDDVDGIITDHPDTAVAARTEMHSHDRLAPVLFDTVMRFVTIF